MRIVFGTLSFLIAGQAAQAVVLSKNSGNMVNEFDALAQSDTHTEGSAQVETDTESQTEFFGKLAKLASSAATAAAPALGAAA